MSKLIPVGSDPGNNTIKTKVNGKAYFVNSIVRKPYSSRMVFGDGDRGNPLNYLDVEVESKTLESGSYYVGNLANSDENQESLGGYKSSNTLLHIAQMVSMAAALVLEYPNRKKFDIYLCTGLPVEEYFLQNEDGKYDFAKVREYKKKIVGEHKFKFNSKLFDNREIILNISHEFTSVMPECYLALLSEISDANGVVKDEYRKPNVYSAMLDIGGGSSDVSGFCNGTYVEKLMFGMDIGINGAQDSLCERIRHKANLRKLTRCDINNIMYDPELQGVMETNKGTFDLHKEKIREYEPVAAEIAYEFKRKLHGRKFDISLLRNLFICGGGGQEIGQIVKKELENDIANIKVVDNAITRNVDAYFLTALAQCKDISEEEKELKVKGEK